MNTNTSNRTYFAGLFEQKKRPKKGLLAFLVTTASMIFSAENVEFDFVTNRRLVAKAKQREGSYTKNGSEIFTNKPYTPPMYKEARPYTIDNFRKRVAGETIYSETEVKALVMDKTAEDLADLSDKIDRSIILQFAYVLQTGKIPFKTKKLSEKGVIADLDYECPSAHFAAATIKWTEANAVPLTDLETRSILIQKACGEAPDTIIFGTDAWQLFLANTQVKAELDNRKINKGIVGPQNLVIRGAAPANMEKDGLNYLGYYIINGKMCGLYAYSDYYLDPQDDTTELPYINAKNVVMMNSTARYNVYYAGINKIIETPAEMRDFLPDARITVIGSSSASQQYATTVPDHNTGTVELRLESAPLVVPTDYNSFGSMQVKD